MKIYSIRKYTKHGVPLAKQGVAGCPEQDSVQGVPILFMPPFLRKIICFFDGVLGVPQQRDL